MPNKNYQRGRAKEYRVKKQWEELGYIMLRTAGSHGFADLIAINPRNRSIHFIQCKPGKMSDMQRAKIEADMDSLIGNESYDIYNQVI